MEPNNILKAIKANINSDVAEQNKIYEEELIGLLRTIKLRTEDKLYSLEYVLFAESFQDENHDIVLSRIIKYLTKHGFKVNIDLDNTYCIRISWKTFKDTNNRIEKAREHIKKYTTMKDSFKRGL